MGFWLDQAHSRIFYLQKSWMRRNVSSCLVQLGHTNGVCALLPFPCSEWRVSHCAALTSSVCVCCKWLVCAPVMCLDKTSEVWRLFSVLHLYMLPPGHRWKTYSTSRHCHLFSVRLLLIIITWAMPWMSFLKYILNILYIRDSFFLYFELQELSKST